MMYIPLYSSTIMFQILLEKGKKSKQSLQTKLWFSIETTVSSQFMWEKFWGIFVSIEKSEYWVPAGLFKKFSREIWFSKARFPLGDKWRYLTIILKTSVIRFTYIKSEFWSSFNIMSDPGGKEVLFLQLGKRIIRKRKRSIQQLNTKKETSRQGVLF